MAPGESWVAVASVTALPEGDMVGVKVGDRLIALYNVAGRIYATDNVCSHAFALLSDGWLDGSEIECPLHAGRFDVTTGKGLGPPIPSDIRTYATRIVGDRIEIDLAE
ncbi:MAG TPA: non-heme iron oxygenase ferredoxin subunit [Stellaceae bacterium]|nr:non-heme iron oxygenase ferredoxin subunit [Stellaceae bacterium]